MFCVFVVKQLIVQVIYHIVVSEDMPTKCLMTICTPHLGQGL